jgi:hypothetical protein
LHLIAHLIAPRLRRLPVFGDHFPVAQHFAVQQRKASRIDDKPFRMRLDINRRPCPSLWTQPKVVVVPFCVTFTRASQPFVLGGRVERKSKLDWTLNNRLRSTLIEFVRRCLTSAYGQFTLFSSDSIKCEPPPKWTRTQLKQTTTRQSQERLLPVSTVCSTFFHHQSIKKEAQFLINSSASLFIEIEVSNYDRPKNHGKESTKPNDERWPVWSTSALLALPEVNDARNSAVLKWKMSELMINFL